MAPTFTDSEKNQIRQQLLDTGRELFATYGLKKTSIEDLTRPAGIAKSSFYAFFDSKEALYLELLMMERRRMREEIAARFPATDDARETIAQFLRAAVREIEANALTRRVIAHPEEWQKIARRVSQEQIEANIAESTLTALSFIREGQESGQIIATKPEVIAGVVRAVVVLAQHKDDIGRDIFPEVQEMMIEFVAKGLTTSDEASATIATEGQSTGHDQRKRVDVRVLQQRQDGRRRRELLRREGRDLRLSGSFWRRQIHHPEDPHQVAKGLRGRHRGPGKEPESVESRLLREDRGLL